MRIIELILLFIGMLLPLIPSSKRKHIPRLLVVFAPLLLLVIHLLFEGYRWQMIPTYGLLALALWIVAKNQAWFTGHWLRNVFKAIPFILVIVIAWLLPLMLPVFTLSEPTGAFAVGSQTLQLDTENKDPLSVDGAEYRSIMVKVWYPAKAETGEKEPYMNEGNRIGFAAKYGLPASALSYLDLIETNTFCNAEIADESFPVLVFSPGHYANASGYYALMEEIVSHGFIVLNINHTYESTGSLFPNGEVKLYNSEYDREHNNQAMAEMVWVAMENFKQANSFKEEQAAIHNLMLHYYAAEITVRWSKDISSVVDALPGWNTSSFLAGHLTLDAVGVFGHSQGGAAAGEALLTDSRIKAGINIDGVQWGQMIDTNLTKPFALLSSDWPAEHPDFNKHAYQHGSTEAFYRGFIKGSGHASFMDIPLMVNIPSLNEAGSIDAHLCHQISASVVVDFFGAWFLNQPLEWKTRQAAIPELVIDKQ